MRVVCCFLLACFICVTASAQKVYFIYLQTENNSPFYLKMGERIYSSSGSGYLILSGLADSTQQFSIGIPSGTSESKFSVPLHGKDRGFLIRFGASPVLIDLQSQSTLKPQTEQTGKRISYRYKNDAFTFLLSKAAHDTTLLYVEETIPVPAVVYEQKKPEREQPKMEQVSVSTDTNSSVSSGEISDHGKNISSGSSTSAVTDSPSYVDEKKPDNSEVKATAEPYTKSVVKKHAESSTSEGFGLVFYDISPGSTDTIRLLIPNPKIQFKKQETEEPGEMLVLNRDSLQKAHAASVQKLPPCKQVATETDFFKLRKLMAARSSDDAMLDEARKAFRSRCYTTEQIRNLSTLFLTSAGKFQFFEVAFRHIADADQFPTLASEIRDDYYSRRFKILAGD